LFSAVSYVFQYECYTEVTYLLFFLTIGLSYEKRIL
jgi:hypothetical protein